MGILSRLIPVLALLCFLFEYSESVSKEVETLRLVHVVVRHADRSPNYGTFPTDTENPAWSWYGGFSEITKVGMRQEFLLGTLFRKRYIETGFLSENYNSAELYVRAMDYDRTLVSARANMGGLYPPVQVGPGKQNLTWQDVSVHTILALRDAALNMYLPCPVADAIFLKSTSKGKARKFLEDNRDFIKFLEKKTGLTIKTVRDLQYIYDPLNCERIHREDHKWPGWVNNDIFGKLSDLYQESTKFYFSNPRIHKFRGSLLLNEIATRSYNKTKDPNMKVKFHAYFAQDVTMLALLEIFGAYNGIMPQYATALIFELHEIHGLNIIRALHINETGSHEFHPIPIKQCGIVGQCSLETFVKLASSITPSNWYAECGLLREEENRVKKLRTTYKVLAVFTGILLILFVAAVIWVGRR